MEIFLFFIAVCVIWYLLWKSLRRIVVYEYHFGLLYRNGKFIRTLDPGRYWINGWTTSISTIDRRIRTETIPGQEVLSEDHVGIKISLGIKYEVEDPDKALHTTKSYHDDLYQTAQLSLRGLIGNQKIETLLENRKTIGEELFKILEPEAQKIGLKLYSIEVKDIMFPGDLKRIFSEEIKAKKEAQALLERTRGETAALRNLANAAKMIENNPALMELRLLQTLNQGDKNSGNLFLTQFPRGNKGPGQASDNS